MPNMLRRAMNWMSGMPTASRGTAFREMGVSGTAVFGGRVQQVERSSALYGANRWRTASNLLVNVSIVAAGVRYFLNLLARPAWIVEPVDDTDAAREAAEFMDSVLHGGGTNWARIVRRSGMYRFHGFGLQEWVAMRRPDGRIGFSDIEPRPCHTIERWDLDPHGTVMGVWQRSPQTGAEIYMPRRKLIYLVDDTMSDSPEGLGWFRNLYEPSELMERYLKLEATGYERDLSGIPVGRAPLEEIDELDATEEEKKALTKGLREFIQIRSKEPDTGLLLSSAPYVAETDTGESISTVMKWGVELLTGKAESIEALGKAIERLTYDMARIIGVENILTGSDGAGSRALSQDKSRNLYLTVNSTLADMAQAYSRDFVDPIWALNGLPEELKPNVRTEDVAFKDVEEITQALANMAKAGATLMPDDPAIDDLRDLMGISRAPEMTPERMGMLMPTPESTGLREEEAPPEDEPPVEEEEE